VHAHAAADAAAADSVGMCLFAPRVVADLQLSSCIGSLHVCFNPGKQQTLVNAALWFPRCTEDALCYCFNNCSCQPDQGLVQFGFKLKRSRRRQTLRMACALKALSYVPTPNLFRESKLSELSCGTSGVQCLPMPQAWAMASQRRWEAVRLLGFIKNPWSGYRCRCHASFQQVAHHAA
jgi:hypothetical protein